MSRVDSDRLKRLIEECGLSQSELARRVGISQASVNKLTSGEGQGSKYLHHIARELGTSVEYLLGETDDPGIGSAPAPRPAHDATTSADRSDLVEIAQIDLSYGMGATYLEDSPDGEGRVFSRAWLRQFTDSPPELLFWAKGQGNSMSPTIDDGEIVLIDRRQNTPRMADLIWAFGFGEIGMMKRLRPMPDGSVKILSDNPSVPIETGHDGEVQIIGRVVAVVKRV
ncbi:XRE family transcriptional regulator [Sphingomonas sp. CJ99]